MNTKSEPKVKSLLVDPEGVKGIKNKYDEIYSANSDVWLYKKSHGVHTVVMSQIKDLLPGKSFMDVGCGAGRLPIMSSFYARESAGFDFSAPAIDIARINTDCAGRKVEFSVATIEDFCRTPARTYDVLALIGTLEHVPDPVAALQQLNRITADGGTLVVSCPNFINPRGYSYMPLLTLFNLPMSLADLRQVDYHDMELWAKESGFSLKRSVGAIYRFGWDKKAAEDMIRRIPLALRDAEWTTPVDFDRYNRWQQKLAGSGGRMLEWLESEGALKRIQHLVDIPVERKPGVDEALWTKIAQYMKEDIDSDPYYSDVDPLCYMGGECIYILEKRKIL